jgi:CRISPR/Cas system-associated exonuclease Cas4 (RecB family)
MIAASGEVPPVRLERTRPKRAQPLKLPCMPIPPRGHCCRGIIAVLDQKSNDGQRHGDRRQTADLADTADSHGFSVASSVAGALHRWRIDSLNTASYTTESMAAKDLIHAAVKNGLIKDGWTVTHDLYPIVYKGETAYADLAAERPIAAERDGQKIVVEVKSFTGRSALRDFEVALGQYRLYWALLSETAPHYKLYLAISDITYQTDFQRQMIQFVVQRDHIPLIVVALDKEEIVAWINR